MKFKYLLLIILLNILLLMNCTYALEDKSVTQVYLNSRDDIQRLSNLGLDIWEVQKDYIIGYLTHEDLKELNEYNFIYTLLYSDGEDYLKNLEYYQFGIMETSGAYHNYTEITTELKQLVNQYPSIATSFSIGTSIEGRDMLMIKIGNSPDVDNGKPNILILGCHHAREWISVEIPFYLAKELLENYSTDTLVQYLVNNAQIYILPIVNPDGLIYSQLSTGSQWRLWRKNRRNNGDGSVGVDLNRNYGYQWGTVGTSTVTWDDTYCGTSSFSEPETQAIRDFASSRPFAASISYHSYGEYILYPWGYTYTPAPDNALLNSMATTMQNLIFSISTHNYTTEQSSILYPAAGDSDDWLYSSQTTMSYTIELRPKTFLGGGFVLPESEIQPTWLENKPAIYQLIQSIIKNYTYIQDWNHYISGY